MLADALAAARPDFIDAALAYVRFATRPPRSLRGDVRPLARRRRPTPNLSPRRTRRAPNWRTASARLKTHAPRTIHKVPRSRHGRLVHGFSMLRLDEAIRSPTGTMLFDGRPSRRSRVDAVSTATGMCGHDRHAAHRHRTDDAGRRTTTLAELADGAALVVNVASKCGLTPQYSALEQLAQGLRRPRADGDRRAMQPVHGPGAGHRRGDPDVLLDHLRGDVPAAGQDRRERPERHPLYAELTKTADADGEAGDVQWNFEKFLLAPGGDGGQPVPAAHRARRARGDRGHRGGPAAIAEWSTAGQVS